MHHKNIIEIISKVVPQIDEQQLKHFAWQRRAELTNHIKIFYNFLYYLGLSPFRFAENNNSRKKYYFKKVCRSQQIFCAFLHILCIFRLISQVREVLPHSRSSLLKKPSLYFDLVLECCSFCFKLMTIKRLWFNSDDYLKVLNAIIKEKCLPVKEKWVNKPAFLYLLYGFCTLKIFSCMIVGYTFVIPITTWSPSWWFRRLVERSRFIFCFSHLHKSTHAPGLETITFWDSALAVLTAFSLYSRYVIAEFCDMYILVFALTLWTTAYSFASEIQMLKEEEQDDDENDDGDNDNNFNISQSLAVSISALEARNNRNLKDDKQGHHHNWRSVYRNFQAVQNLSEVINIAMGAQITWYLAEGLMYYSIHLNTIFITNDMFIRLFNICFFILTFHNLYISADICCQLETAKSWIVRRNNIKAVPKEEAYIVLLEIITKDIGIRGNNTFTITFPLAAAYLSLIVTFFVICVQESDLKLEEKSFGSE